MNSKNIWSSLHYHYDYTLFQKLLDRETPIILVRILLFWYTKQTMCVIWGNCMSDYFYVSNGFRQGGTLSPKLYSVYVDDLSDYLVKSQIGCHIDNVCVNHVMYADDICLMAPSPAALQKLINICYDFSIQNNLSFNSTKSFCMVFKPRLYNLLCPTFYMNTEILDYAANIKYLGFTFSSDKKDDNDMLHPKVLGLTLDPKLTYNAHIQNIATHAQKPLQVIKALTGTTWGKQKETLVATYKAVMRPTLEYASSIWSPMASPTSINKLQVMQNAALRACTGCTHDTNIQHLHDETNILPIQKHLQLHASQIRQKAQYPSHPLHKYTTYNNSQRLMKPTTFNNSRYTTNIPTDPCTVTTADIKANMRDIHTTIVSQHLAARDNNKILRTHPPQVSRTEENLPRHTRRTPAQLRTNKSPFLLSYLHKIDASTHPSPLCPLCRTHEHTTQHLFSCPQIPTTLSALDLWRDPSGVAALLDDWREKLAANPHKLLIFVSAWPSRHLYFLFSQTLYKCSMYYVSFYCHGTHMYHCIFFF